MKTLLAGLLVIVIGCADAMAGPQGTPLSGRWNVASTISVGSHICQAVGYIDNIGSPVGNIYPATFDGLRGCDANRSLPGYSNNALRIRATADSVWFDFDATTHFYGERLPEERTWSGHMRWTVYGETAEGWWSAVNCRIITNCVCSDIQVADGTCGR